MLVKNLVLVSIFLFTSSAYAAPMEEKLSICYNFSNEKLIKKSTCIVSNGYGAGGTYTSIEQGKTEYNIESTNNYNEKTDSYEESEPTLNGLSAEYYHRDLFYNRITDTNLITESSLNCFLTKNKKIDICYK